jgi:hypothetical protein
VTQLDQFCGVSVGPGQPFQSIVDFQDFLGGVGPLELVDLQRLPCPPSSRLQGQLAAAFSTRIRRMDSAAAAKKCRRPIPLPGKLARSQTFNSVYTRGKRSAAARGSPFSISSRMRVTSATLEV